MDSMEIDDDMYFSKDLAREGLVTRVSGDLLRRKQPSSCVTVCLGLLCSVLVAGIIGQFIYYERTSRPPSTELLQADYNGSGRDEVQARFEGLKAANCSALKTDGERWRASSGAARRDLAGLRTEHLHLQTRYDWLRNDSAQLQSRYDALRRETERLQANYSSVAADRDREQEAADKMRLKVRGMFCQSSWRKFDTSCYYISSVKKNWTESRRACIAQAADLVVIDSMEEQVFVNGLLTSGQNAWIGLMHGLHDGTWRWVEGTPVTTTFWQSGQPNNYGGDQHCGEYVQTATATGGRWNDDGCFAYQLWICEK